MLMFYLGVITPQAMIGTTFFRFWGWNSEVNVFDTHTVTWEEPETHVSVCGTTIFM